MGIFFRFILLLAILSPWYSSISCSSSETFTACDDTVSYSVSLSVDSVTATHIWTDDATADTTSITHLNELRNVSYFDYGPGHDPNEFTGSMYGNIVPDLWANFSWTQSGYNLSINFESDVFFWGSDSWEYDANLYIRSDVVSVTDGSSNSEGNNFTFSATYSYGSSSEHTGRLVVEGTLSEITGEATFEETSCTETTDVTTLSTSVECNNGWSSTYEGHVEVSCIDIVSNSLTFEEQTYTVTP